MSHTKQNESTKADPSVPVAPMPERNPDELEPTHVTPAGRFWEITLRPDLEEALRTDRF